MEYFFKIADTCLINCISGHEQSYIVNQINGCWCTFSSKHIAFVSMFIGNSISYSDLRLDGEQLLVLRTLFFHGILEINNSNYLLEKHISETGNDITIVINTTNRCNLHCKYCYAYSHVNSNANFHSNDLINNLVKLIGDYTNKEISIVFHGGEPLLCWDEITEMVKILENKFNRIIFSIQTNGVLLTPDMVDFITTHKIKVGISIDGHNHRSNVNRFGKDRNDYLNRIIDNIDLLINNNIRIGILSVITTNNYRELLNSISFYVSKGVKAFGFNFCILKGRGTNINNEISIVALVDVYIKLACYINDYNEQHEQQEYISERTISVLIYSLSHKSLGACFSTPCNAGDSLYALDVNGDVYPCDEFVGNKKFCIGNIGNSDFSINNIQNENLTALRHRKCNSISKCAQCSIRELCPFKCPSDSYYRTGNLFQPHSMCDFIKQILPQYMYLLQNNIISPKYFIFN